MIPFRKKSLTEATAPEQLDKLLTVVSPYSWLILVTLVALAVCVVFWSIYGSITSRVFGKGIFLTYDTSLVDATAEQGGRVLEVQINMGEKVKKGQLIAKISKPDLEQNIITLEKNIAVLAQEKSQLQERSVQDVELKTNYVQKQKEVIDHIIQSREKDLVYLASTLQKKEEMVKQGYLTKDALEKTFQDQRNLTKEIFSEKSELLSLVNSIEELKHRLANDLDRVSRDYQDKVAELERLKSQRLIAENITSPVDGIVTNIQAQLGDQVPIGAPIASILRTGTGIRAVGFFPAEQGRTVKPNMKTLIEPAGIKKEEYGSIIGTVSSVGEFPLSLERLRVLLHNDDLAKKFSGEISLIEVHVAINLDSQGQIEWTSKKGKTQTIDPGTLCSLSVITSSKPPILLVIPTLKKILGVGA